MVKQNKYLFLVEFKCEEADAGKEAVVATTAAKAGEAFFKRWHKEYNAGEGILSPDALLWYRVVVWCDADHLTFG